MIPAPASTADALCRATLFPAIGIGLVFGILFGFAKLNGCHITEGGTGQCLILGIDIMQPLTVAYLLTGLVFVFIMPLLLLIALVSGAICLFRRRW